MLEKSKENYKFNDIKDSLNLRLIKLEQYIKREKFTLFENDIQQIRNLINQKAHTEEIENNFNDLEQNIIKFKKSKEIEDFEENNISQILINKKQHASKKANILYTYSKLFSIIDEFKNIKNDYQFLNRVIKFDDLVNESIISVQRAYFFRM